MAEDFSTTLEFAPEWDDEPFTMVPTVWAREGLHWEDMGFLFWARTHRKGFRFTEQFMINATPGGRDKLRTILRRLEKAGKLDRRKDRGPDGRITGTTLIVLFPSIRTTGQRTEKPSVDADQGERDASAGQTGSGFTVDGKPVNGQLPAETAERASKPSTEKPFVDADQGERDASAGRTSDGFSIAGSAVAGESATKKEQLKGIPSERKTTTTRGGANDAPAAGRTEPDGSGSSGISTEHTDEALVVLRAAVDPTAAARLTAAESTRLVDRVAALLAAGTSSRELRAQLAPVTSSSTTHPAARLTARLEEIAAGGENPLAAPARQATAGVEIDSTGERHLKYRPCGARDCTGGTGDGRGSGRYRRRIDPHTGHTNELCNRLVATRDGQKVTCHPDATPAMNGGS
jgi:hypothetical protein